MKEINRSHCNNRFCHLGIAGLFAVLMAWGGIAAAAVPGTASEGGDILRATLANGLRVIIVRNALAPVVTTQINYLAGSNEAPDGFPGMAHAQEHMMFRGSPGLSAGQLAAISAGMGGKFDADTQQSVTQYAFTVPDKDLDVALHIEAIRMAGVLDSEALWKRERGAIEQEVAQDLSSPDYVFYTRLLTEMFKDTPYAHDPLGTRASFDQTTGAMLQSFYDKWYAPNNAVLIIVGDVRPEQALARVRTLFGGIPARPLAKRPAIHLEPVQAQTLRLDTDQPYGTAVISFRMPGYDSIDYAAAEVLSDVLSSERGKLYGLVPQGSALSASFSLSTFRQSGLGFAASTFPKDGDARALLEQMRHILGNYAKNGVSPDLVTAAKKREMAAAEFQKNSVSGLASVWSQAVAVEGLASPDDGVRAIQAVTVADVNRVARQYLDFDHAISAILTPQTSGKPVVARGFGGKESFAPKQVKAVKLPAWAETDLNRLTIPASTVHPIVTVLPNGLKLIVQTESISHTVSIYGHIDNKPDLEQPVGQEGVNDVLGQLFSYGTKTLDRVAFQEALDAIAADESAGTDFSLQVMKNNLHQGIRLLADNELHPALPEAAFNIIRRQVAAAVAGELQSPGYLTNRALHAELFPKQDPTLREATPESVSSLSIGDVENYYRHVFRPDLTTIVVIGDVVPEQVKAEIEKFFGAWTAVGPKPETQLPGVVPNKPSTTRVPDASRVQDQVILAETLAINRFDPDYYALELGNHVLGGAFYATWLYRDLREKRGLVYYVDSSFQVGKTRAVYLVNYASDPSSVVKARAIVVRDLRQMQNAPVSADDLRRAKTLLLREVSLSEASVDHIAAGLISRAVLGLPLDEPTRAARRYIRLTARQVQAAYVKWISPSRLVQVTEGPQ
uniref:Peptidase M16 domain protein n=1 Tax=mine drainage metagenome TaxID=410659 RepID=E6QTE1_9ZZZZ